MSKRHKAADKVGGDDNYLVGPSQKSYQYLKPRTRHIPQDVITTKWSALPNPAQQQVRELFTAAKRPVILGCRNEKRRREAEVALGAVVGKLEKQLPRMPFPPKTREYHFDLEKLMERNVCTPSMPLLAKQWLTLDRGPWKVN